VRRVDGEPVLARLEGEPPRLEELGPRAFLLPAELKVLPRSSR